MSLIIQIKNNLGGWNTLTPDTKSLKFTNKKINGKEFSRLTADGDMLFCKYDYKFLQSLTNRTPEIRFIQNGSTIINGTIDLTQNTDFDYQIMKLKSKISDVYTLFEDFGDTEYNTISAPNGAENQLRIIDDELEIETITFSTSFPDILGVDVDGNGMPLTNIPFEVAGDAYGLYSAYYTGDNPSLPIYNNVDTVFKTIIGYGYYDGETATPPPGSGWVFIRNDFINNNFIPIYGSKIDETSWTTSFPSISEALYQNNVDLEQGTNIFRRFKRFDTLLKYVVGQIDSTIKFEDNQTPAITDSFYFMKTYEGEIFQSEYATTGNYSNDRYPYADLLVMALSDAIPDEFGNEKTDGARITNVTFNSLMSWLEHRGFYWKIEERADGNYFIIDHFLNKSLTNTNKNLFQLSQINWIKKTNNVEYIEPTYNKIHNSDYVGGSLNFIGFDVLFPDINVNADLQWGGQTVLSDINDIRTFRETKYNETATDQVVMLSAISYLNGVGDKLYILKKATGDLITRLENNIELSWSYLSERLIANLPDVSANINGNLVSLSNSRLEKRKKVKFKVPIHNIKTDFDLTGLIGYYDNQAEIEEITIASKENVAEMIIKY